MSEENTSITLKISKDTLEKMSTSRLEYVSKAFTYLLRYTSKKDAETRKSISEAISYVHSVLENESESEGSESDN